MILLITFYLSICFCFAENTESAKKFAVQIKKVEIVDLNEKALDSNDYSQVKRLIITTDIINKTKDDYPHLKYAISLNKEVGPYIASMIVDFVSDEYYGIPLPQGTPDKSIPHLMHGLPVASGFMVEWSMLLTQEQELVEYFNVKFKSIADNFKYIDVTLSWDGGNQFQRFPIKLAIENENIRIDILPDENDTAIKNN